MKTIKEIKDISENINADDIPKFIEEYRNDCREGIKKIMLGIERKILALKKEMDRLEEISKYEEEYFHKGYKYIAGIDEVGRGPLAGPVVTCAVVLPQGFRLMGIDDSKKLSAKKREELYHEIVRDALAYEIGIVDAKTIDEINILQATYKAMRISVNNLKVTPDCLFVDALKIPELPFYQVSIVKGDTKSISIAAASIVAKVTRDRIMESYHDLYPEYDFLSNKGYGSAFHIKAIEKYGLCSIHRISFTREIIKAL